MTFLQRIIFGKKNTYKDANNFYLSKLFSSPQLSLRLVTVSIPHLAPRLRISGAIPSLPYMTLWSVRGKLSLFYLAHQTFQLPSPTLGGAL
jgi:hypothetical protein